MEIEWKYVKDRNPKKSGIYLAATQGNKKAIPCEYSGGKYYFLGFEGENGEKVEMAPYAWAEMPDKPKMQ